MRVVLDTSVLITALRSSNGAAAEVIRLLLIGNLILLLDEHIMEEYLEVALRQANLRAFGRTRRQVGEVIADLEATGVPVQVAIRHRPLSPDRNDDMVLDVAINGNADAIVTNNLKDFAGPAQRFGILALTPGQLLHHLRNRS